MATLLAVMNGKHAVACCNAKCYDAVSKRCRCICGGLNHGVGYVEAAAAMELTWAIWLGAWLKAHPDVETTGYILGGDHVRKDEKLLV